MMASDIFFKYLKTEWEPIDDKIKRQIVGFDDKVMMVNVRFEKGGVGAIHNHPHSQVTHISEGKFEVTIGEETSVLEKGDSFHVASEVYHGVVCLEAGMLVDVFSPIREDFIK